AAGRRGGARRGTWEPAAILAAVARPSSLPPPPPRAYTRRDPRMRVWRALLLVVLLPGIAAAQDAPTTKATFQKGVDALKAGRLDEAEAAFRRVLQQGDTHAYVHNNLAIVYQQQGRHAEAVAESREAIRLDPTYAPPRVVLGASLLALGRVAEA